MKKAMKQSILVRILNIGSIVLLAGIMLIFIANTRYMEKITQASEDRYDLTHYVQTYIEGSSNLTNAVRGYVATADQALYDAYFQELDVDKNRSKGLDGLHKIGITEEEKNYIDQMADLSNMLVPLEKSAMELARAGKKDMAIDYVYGDKYNQSYVQIRTLQSQFLQNLDARTTKEIAHMKKVLYALNMANYIMIFAIMCIQLVNYIAMYKKVIRPITALQNEMREIANGNLSSDFNLEGDTSEIGMLISDIHHTKHELKKYIDDISRILTNMAQGNMDLDTSIHYRGDFAPIMVALNGILDSLNETLSRLGGASNQVSMNADQVSSGAQELAQGSTQQSGVIEKLSESVIDLSVNVSDGYQQAVEICDNLGGISQEILNSNQEMGRMLDAMSDISDKSKQIHKIIKNIEDIAFQTNILALNAAVEAARAGTAGKGFAVVADEVRSLAATTSEAVQNTTSLIEASVSAVSHGRSIADSTAALLGSAASKTETVVHSVEGIVESYQALSYQFSEIAGNVDQIASVVQNNTATAEESAAAAEELNAQAIQLQEMANKFHLRRAKYPEE